MIRIVIFDLDGTLVDAYSAVAGSLNYTLSRMRHAPVDDQTVKRSVGWGDRHLIAHFVRSNEVDRALSIFRRHHARALKSGTSFLPGVRELLDKLKAQRYMLAVASNRPTRFTRIILDHLKVKSIFDYVLCGDKVARPKPAGDVLTAVLAKFSLSPDRALYVGDMTIDIQCGHAADVKTVGVATGSNTREELLRLAPLSVISDIRDLAGIIRQLNADGGL